MSVPLCLQVFCDQTKVALLTHSETKDLEKVTETADFIDLVVKYWKIVSVKCQGMDKRKNDELLAEIRSPNDSRLSFLLEFGNMCLKMKSKPRKRERQLTRDTALAIYHTCCGLVELVRYLLSTSHDYVCSGNFSTDKLEKDFSKKKTGGWRSIFC